jgi:Holliday junction resolvase RusA-like endonuclease
MIITQVWVPGHPKTKGSMRLINGQRGRQTMAEDVEGSAGWREKVAEAVRADRRRTGTPTIAHSPISVRAFFWLEPPTSTWSEIGAAQTLGATWARAGDVDKLSRNVLDACADDANKAAMNGGAYANDNQVVSLDAFKLPAGYCTPGDSGAVIIVEAIEPDVLQAMVRVAEECRRRTIEPRRLRLGEP